MKKNTEMFQSRGEETRRNDLGSHSLSKQETHKTKKRRKEKRRKKERQIER